MASRFSGIAHEGILLWNPLHEAETLGIVDSIAIDASAHVLDVGCGQAELLIRLLERTGARGVGIDSWPAAIEGAQARAAGRVDPDRLDLRAEPFRAEDFAGRRFDVALCIGSTHAAGGLRPTLRALQRLLVSGGTALVAEGYWRREPDPRYLAFLGCERDSYLDRAGNVAAAEQEGFDVVRELVSTCEDFDAYEDRYAANVEAFVARHPDDPDADAFRDRIRAWRGAYLQWGRDTLGFALHVLRRR